MDFTLILVLVVLVTGVIMALDLASSNAVAGTLRPVFSSSIAAHFFQY